MLQFAPQAASEPVRKVLQSAIANARVKADAASQAFDERELVITEAYVDEGPTLKRFRPRAQGRASRINKRTSHITVTVLHPDAEERPARRTEKAAAKKAAQKSAQKSAAKTARSRPRRRRPRPPRSRPRRRRPRSRAEKSTAKKTELRRRPRRPPRRRPLTPPVTRRRVRREVPSSGTEGQPLRVPPRASRPTTAAGGSPTAPSPGSATATTSRKTWRSAGSCPRAWSGPASPRSRSSAPVTACASTSTPPGRASSSAVAARRPTASAASWRTSPASRCS